MCQLFLSARILLLQTVSLYQVFTEHFVPWRWSHSTVRCYAEHDGATLRSLSVCLSVCPSVSLSMTFRYRDHIGWNTSKIISRLNTLRYLLRLAPTSAIWSTELTPKIGWNKGGIRSTKKLAISPKLCKIGPRLLWRTNRKLHMPFWLVPKSLTLDDLERTKCHSCKNKKVLQSPPEKFERR